VLVSKISVPALPGWAVPRKRIDNLIALGAGGPLTVVTGPPGAGKTMAITSWASAHTDPGALAWITLDEYDNRPQVFWSYAVAALRRAGIAVPRITAGGRGNPVGHDFLVRLASALAPPGEPATVVIDDFHVLTDTGILDSLAYVFRSAAPGLRLVVSSRIEPLLPLHRYRLSRELTEIRAGDLAFTPSESSLLMAQHGVTLSGVALDSLTSRTEGWAAGIRLAAISLNGHTDPEQFVKELGAEDSAVTGYLVEEVLNAQPAYLRDFLLRTSILDRINSDIAAEFSDSEPAMTILPGLAAANAFVRPLGNGWYGYHPLFAEILRLKLRREFPGQLPDLHRQAAGWYLRNGYLMEAVRHAAAAGDWPLAAWMVLEELAISHLIEPQSDVSIFDVFRAFPGDTPGIELPQLLVAAAMELADETAATGSDSLSTAESALEQLPAEDEILARLAAATIRMAVSRKTGDLDQAIAAGGRAERVLAAMPEHLLARHPGIRAQVLLASGTVKFWAGETDRAADTLRDGIAAASAPGSSREKAACLGQLSLLDALRGRLSHAAQLAGDAGRATEEHDQERVVLALPAASAALAYVHLERNELREAHEQLTLADAALRIQPDPLVASVASLIAARCRLAEGHVGAALELISRVRRNWLLPQWLEHELALVESQACVAAGNRAAAVEAAARAVSPVVPGAPVAMAYAWLGVDDREAASHALAETGSLNRQDPENLDGWLADARLSYGNGDVARGRRSLERALRLGKPEQIRLPFVRERSWLRPILRRDPDLIRGYRQLLEPDLPRPARAPGAPAVPDRTAPLVIEPLSEREREVLERLSGMLTTTEIAAEMFISVNTVKTHLKSIYRKLAAEHRGEAVRRARQLKLI
jgi:LuxR family maltose regulon positive regulatory protein